MAETGELQGWQRGAHPPAHRVPFKEGERAREEPAPGERSSQEERW